MELQTFSSTSHSKGGRDIEMESSTSHGDMTHSSKGEFEQYRLRRWATALMVWAMAIAVVSPGDYFGFNGGYAFGSFLGYVIAVIFDTVMFICLTYTLSELAAMMPYAGGSYVWSRNAGGRFLGCISGCLDSIEYMCGAGCITPLIGYAIVYMLDMDLNYTIPFALVSHVIIALVHSVGGRLVWWITLGFGLYVLLGIVLFFFGTIAIWVWGDNLHYQYPESSSSGAKIIDDGLFLSGVSSVFRSFAPGIWCFLGIEAVPLIAEECKDPKKSVPKAMVLGIYTIAILTWMTILSAAFLPTGITTLSATFLPLNYGYTYIFQGSISDKGLTALTLPILFSSPFVFTFSYGRQMFALSRAGYIPGIFCFLMPYTRQPVVSIWFGVVFCTVVQVICYFAADVTFNVIFYACVIPALLNYIIISVCFILYRYYLPLYENASVWSLTLPKAVRKERKKLKRQKGDFEDLIRRYISPVGIYGAFIVIVLALLSLACSFWAVKEFKYSLVIWVPIVLAAAIYYIFYARFHLKMPPEERECAGLVLLKMILRKDTTQKMTGDRLTDRILRVLL